MKLVFGVSDNRIPIWDFLPGVEVMINNLGWRWGRPPARVVWVDSGGYQAMVRGVKLCLESVVARFRSLDGDIYISLDTPPTSLCPDDRGLVLRNIEVFDVLRSRLDDRVVVPVVHCYAPHLMLEAIDIYRSLGAKIIAFGGAVPPSMARMGRGSRVAPLIALAIAVKASRVPIHALGIGGSITMYSVVKVLGASSVDSSSWRVKAAYGKIVVPGLGERYVGDGRARFGRVDLKPHELEILKQYLEKTGFPYIDKVEEMLKTFRGRAIINAWIMHCWARGVVDGDVENWMVRKARLLNRMDVDELVEELIRVLNTR